ncbi:CHAP domain-containing protein, partial [Dysosmobacter welbionis]|uniref:CHAP domain-containing protein n=1 Tax=Dysosmobacter welbionis TaxID=2093857 RepID=UPI003AB593A6
MATAEKILEIARSQIGTKESPAKSDNVKYNTAYYGRAVSGGGYPWCAVFVWWVFREAGASDLYYGGDKTAYCPTLMFFHKKQKVTNYRPGDIVFFNFSGKSSAGHVGICESWDGTYITTIDGNTGGASEDNGGAVMRRRRHKKYIVGAYRPDYEEEESVTYEQWLEYLERYRREAAAKKASMPELLEEAVELG